VRRVREAREKLLQKLSLPELGDCTEMVFADPFADMKDKDSVRSKKEKEEEKAEQNTDLKPHQVPKKRKPSSQRDLEFDILGILESCKESAVSTTEIRPISEYSTTSTVPRKSITSSSSSKSDFSTPNAHKYNWNAFSSSNPFGTLLTAHLPAQKDLPLYLQLRYYIHDQVQDELRHAWRKRQDGETAAEVARKYVDGLPREWTSEVKMEFTVDGKKLIEPLVGDEVLRSVFAVRFLERAEESGW